MAELRALVLLVAVLASACTRAGDPCGAHDACGAGLCHVGRCTGSGAPVVREGASRVVRSPSQLRALDDDGDADEARFASTRGVARVYVSFDVTHRAGERAYLVLEPSADAPPWDAPITIDVHPIEEPWSSSQHEPRLGVRAFSVTLPPGPSRRILLDVTEVRARYGFALRAPAGAGVGARLDARATHLDLYR